MKKLFLRIFVCLLVGHKTIEQVKIHRKRIAGMHRGICKRCGKILWITYPEEKD
jgi:hypothetical protein